MIPGQSEHAAAAPGPGRRPVAAAAAPGLARAARPRRRLGPELDMIIMTIRERNVPRRRPVGLQVIRRRRRLRRSHGAPGLPGSESVRLPVSLPLSLSARQC
jgi:hypothetical protein